MENTNQTKEVQAVIASLTQEHGMTQAEIHHATKIPRDRIFRYAEGRSSIAADYGIALYKLLQSKKKGKK